MMNKFLVGAVFIAAALLSASVLESASGCEPVPTDAGFPDAGYIEEGPCQFFSGKSYADWDCDSAGLGC